MQGWLNVIHALLRADYIGFSLLRLDDRRAVVASSLVYKEQYYIWFLGDIYSVGNLIKPLF